MTDDVPLAEDTGSSGVKSPASESDYFAQALVESRVNPPPSSPGSTSNSRTPILSLKRKWFHKDEKESEERYKIVLDIRKFEIELFWRRTAFFWGTIVVLFGLYGTASKELKDQKLLCYIVLTGFFFNILFSLSLRASKYWQEHWEYHADRDEETAKFELLSEDVNAGLRHRLRHESRLYKPRRLSLSAMTIVLSDLLAFAWLGLIVKEVHEIVIDKTISLNLRWELPIHWNTIGIMVFAATGMFSIAYYIYVESKKKRVRKREQERIMAINQRRIEQNKHPLPENYILRYCISNALARRIYVKYAPICRTAKENKAKARMNRKWAHLK